MPILCVRIRMYHHGLQRPLWSPIHVIDGLDVLEIFHQLRDYSGPIRICCYQEAP